MKKFPLKKYHLSVGNGVKFLRVLCKLCSLYVCVFTKKRGDQALRKCSVTVPLGREALQHESQQERRFTARISLDQQVGNEAHSSDSSTKHK